MDTRRTLPPALLLALLAPPALLAAAPGAVPSTVSLRGTVVDERGRPVAGATVSGTAVLTVRHGRYSSVTVAPLRERTTDARGAFALEVTRGTATPAVSLRARHGGAFTARAVELRGEALRKPVTLRVSPKNARALKVRVLDEDGKPVRGATVTATHMPTAPAPYGSASPRPAELPGTARATDSEGRLEAEPCLDPDGSYRLEVNAKGFLPEKTTWKSAGGGPVAFGDVVLRRLRALAGQVLDRKGKPVAGAKVVRVDGRKRVEGTTDDEGRFKLRATFFTPDFLFVDKPGFRFHGQRCDRPGTFKVILTRRDEKPAQRMTTLPPAGTRAERKGLAARLLRPYLDRALKKGEDERMRALETLGKLDPGRLLEELEKRPLKDPWYDGYVRRAAVKGLLAESFDEARAVVDSMKDPGFRCTGYTDLCDALPEGRRAEKLKLLQQALLHSRAIKANDHRVIHLGGIAARLWALGEKKKASALLREGQAVAKELPTAAWAGYARGAFAEDLALVDLPGALALMKDLKDPFEYVRHHGNLMHKLGGTDPAGAERVFHLLLRDRRALQNQREQYVVRTCYRMAPADLPRARRLAGTIKDAQVKARAYGVMAQALAKSRPKEALALLDHAFDLLAKYVASGGGRFNGTYHPAAVAGLMLPAAEQVDPGLVNEFFWRTVSLRAPAVTPGTEDQWGMEAGSLGALALVLARYDHELAMVFVEAAEKHRREPEFGRDPYLLAAAIADPRRTVALVEKLPDGPNKDYTRQSVVNVLLGKGDAVWRAVHRDLGQWYVDDEDL